MQPPKSSTCVICGINPSTTVEHVPPKCFLKGIKGQRITVPGCFDCNNGSSEEDERLRNYISAEVGGNTPASKIMWKEGGLKGLNRNNKHRNIFLETTREVEVIDALGEKQIRLAFEMPVALYVSVFSKITKGLYFYHTGKIFPASTKIHIDSLIDKPDELEELTYNSICSGAFKYWYLIEGNSSLWFIEIHSGHWAMAKTGAICDIAL